LVNHPEQVIVVDETHKDKNASRRRKAWGKRNSGGVALLKWFKNTVRYTMLAALNMDGFVQSSIEIVRRDEVSDEGAAGTVDKEHFESWVRDYLCTNLGQYRFNEKNSIVVMDNASTHMNDKIRVMIEAKGAILLYTAPYSPDKSPIEYCFGIYKASLKRNCFTTANWYEKHLLGIQAVTRDKCIKEFRRCKIPGSEMILPTDELYIIISLLRYFNDYPNRLII